MTSKVRQRQYTFAGLRRLLINKFGGGRTIDSEVDTYLNQLQQNDETMIELARSEGFQRGAEQTRALMENYVEEGKRAAEEIARRDPFTGLYSKQHFLREMLPGFIYEAARDRRDVEERRSDLAALWVIDLDKLKPVNDTLGHLVGDAMILHLSTLLKQHIRQETAVSGRISQDDSMDNPEFAAEVEEEERGLGDTGKVGGDEFAVLQTNIKRYFEAHFVADRVKQQYRRHDWRQYDERLPDFHPEVSIGVVILRLVTVRGFQGRAD
ncbi:MAG TPA: diguanylate cyclase, partial [Verrucomicrobiae bacterium]|nr:diguanylate cyclase [Verrucomicrobiae bacterium]